ncbi:putative glycolipid-binding domain-containing protein [Nocardia sp. NBC_01327]|uniref:putative glycolipid-binding domain-containing protein n=1 Tax=Nocardia sp. NBC_01327 TaxID=2903593 RepID=UPI002E0F2C92|nr:putative glycolipid-binding domain-containing protein [Nocardia sp. NBC_01327]
MRTFVWQGIDEPRMEIVQVESLDRARGTQIGLVYELRWQLDGSELIVDIGDGPVRHSLEGADFFDVQHAVFFNSLPVLRDGLLLPDATPRDYTMRYVDVPQLTSRLAAQRYQPRGKGVVGFSSGDYSADIEFDGDGFVTDYQDYVRRLHP